MAYGPEATQLTDALAAIQALCDPEDRSLAGAEGNQVGFGAHQAAWQHPLRPVVVVRNAAQRCFHPARDDRDLLEGLTAALRVYGVGPVGAPPDFTAR